MRKESIRVHIDAKQRFSSLAALYDQCAAYGNIPVFAFQNEDGFVQIGNYSRTDGWPRCQLSTYLIWFFGRFDDEAADLWKSCSHSY